MAPLRWHLRFDNFKSALTLLDEGVAIVASEPSNDLLKAGLIQRFEITWELGWKVIRDYLSDSGAPLAVATPINAIRAGFEAGLIEDGDAWVAAMRARNAMAHEYDAAKYESIFADIAAKFAPLLRALKQRLDQEIAADN